MKKKSGKSLAAVGDAESYDSPEPRAFCLPGCVAIRNARELREQCLAQVSNPTMRVDASAVIDVDTAGLQLMLAWQRAIVATGGKFEWASVSPALRDAAAAVGLSRELGMPGAT
jgi:anti-anti-sigma regulatory factor